VQVGSRFCTPFAPRAEAIWLYVAADDPSALGFGPGGRCREPRVCGRAHASGGSGGARRPTVRAISHGVPSAADVSRGVVSTARVGQCVCDGSRGLAANFGPGASSRVSTDRTARPGRIPRSRRVRRRSGCPGQVDCRPQRARQTRQAASLSRQHRPRPLRTSRRFPGRR
jgi:hypothetical protein